MAAFPLPGSPAWSSRAATPPSKSIAVTANPQTVEVLWSQLKGGAANDGTNGSDVVGFEWGFDWVFNGTPYSADVTIDNLEFF